MPLTNRMYTLHWLGREGGGTALVVSNKIYLILPPSPLAVNFPESSLSTMLYSEPLSVTTENCVILPKIF